MRILFCFCCFFMPILGFSFGEDSFSSKMDNDKKIVYLISPPRSLSVGFLRMIEARGDFKIYHEPSLLPYFNLHGYTFADGWFREGALQSFSEVKTAIFHEKSNVFVKEMSFHFRDFLDDEIMNNPNVYFIFLLREPHHTIVSFYKKIGSIVDDFHEAVGYQSTWEIYQKISDKSSRKPLIIFSEELSSHPEDEVRRFCDYVKIPFIESSLSWKNLGEDFKGNEEWHEGKMPGLVQHWHGNAIQSTRFETLRSYETDALGNPTFSEIENQADRQECERAYRHHLPYYQFFKSKRS
ncbi:MAG TPA: hypothetical protein VLG76_07750 [Rhabdochlamydiaceae bacterium]|nr:hypothetical protein [Rhabdochlamydiaceae bacterium]